MKKNILLILLLIVFSLGTHIAFADDDNDGIPVQFDLQRTDYRATHLERFNFSGMNLEGFNFEKAKLEKANFTGANLKGANFRGADVEEENLTTQT